MKNLVLAIACALALSVVACSYFDRDVEETSGTSTDRSKLQEKFDVVMADVVYNRDQASGWPSADDCDGTLWAGLLCAAGAPGVNIDLAELGPGVIGRKPGKACWDATLGDQGSKSTTSNDMVQGYFWCAWRTQRLDLLEKFATACESRPVLFEGVPACIIGEPHPAMASRVVLRPNLLGSLGRMLYAMTDGSDRRDYRALPSLYVGLPDEDYARHLQSLGIALNGEVHSRSPKSFAVLDATPQERAQLQALVQKDPTDWTAAAALAVYTGDYGPVTATLLADSPCPTYSREPINCKVSWLFAARLVLDHLKDAE